MTSLHKCSVEWVAWAVWADSPVECPAWAACLEAEECPGKAGQWSRNTRSHWKSCTRARPRSSPTRRTLCVKRAKAQAGSRARNHTLVANATAKVSTFTLALHHRTHISHTAGQKAVLRQVGPGLVTQETVPCGNCAGSGQIIPEKQRCKKCKGKKVVESKSVLELYIPRGAKEGERIVLAGEGDQLPDQEPGDIVFTLSEAPHETFDRAGADLRAELNISLVEALTGFNRVVLTHLDGRGIQLNVTQEEGKVLRPGQVLKVPGEGMPLKRSDAKGDLYLVVDVEFPEDGWLKDDAARKKVRDALPPPEEEEKRPDDVDEVQFEDADMEDFGAGSGDPRAGGGEWEDEEEEAGPQCATQ
jgi:DnaJ family protein A protein 2